MANPEHLKILKQGAEVWNQWRKDNADVIPELSGADLKETNLKGANLSHLDLSNALLHSADLREADLRGADLRDADLCEADLSGANLNGANLDGANLRNAELCGANISRTDFNVATLIDADLSEANLSRADLRWTKLFEANLYGTKLNGADLIDADLSGANLNGAKLSNADLSGASLYDANLSGAYLREANLSNADLSGADLSNADLNEAILILTDMILADLTNANITGACLFGTARDKWKIDGIKCDYIYFDQHRIERIPKDRDFRPGEFEELYRSLPTFEYYFEEGFTPIDAVIMDRVVQTINEKHPEYHLDIVAFDKRGTPHATITVLHKKYTEVALQEIKVQYEERIKELKRDKETLLKMNQQLIDNPREIKNIYYHIEGDKTDIRAGGDVAYAKDRGEASIVKDNPSSVPGDDNGVKG